MNRPEGLVLLSADLERLEADIVTAANHAELNMLGWRKSVDGPWLEKAAIRVMQLKAYVDDLRKRQASSTAAATGHH